MGRSMRAGFVLAIALAIASTASATTEPPPLIIYSGATLIDVQTGKATPDMAILTRGERIETIRAVSDLSALAGATRVDVSGLYVSPGLINTHEHLATPPNRPWAEAMMRRDLYGGITTVRDMADDLRNVADLARASQIGEIPGPDLYFAALMAGPAFFEDPRTHATSAGATAGAVPWMQAITRQTDIPLAVARAQGTGATAIKIYADLPADLVTTITKEAHRQGMLVWAHAAVFPTSPAEGLSAGVDSVSHVCMLAYQASDSMPGAYHHRPPVEATKFGAGDNAAVQSLFETMRAKGTILDATLLIYADMARDHAADPKSPAPYCSDTLAERLANQAWRDGVLISAGTDGFSPQADPWPALQDELLLLQDKAGMPPADVVRAATLTGAMTMHLQDETGVIAPGKLANMVFTAQNPLKSVAAYKSVVLTVKRGAAYWRKNYPPVNAAEMRGAEE
jgi:imidazolonepropionase-like amidohydrolase